MFSEFLQYGYLGLLAMLIYLCFKVIDGSKKNDRTFNQTLVILFFFSLISVAGGSTGYFWASKELEVAKKIESSATILKQQIEASRISFNLSIEPLNKALDGAVNNFNISVLNSTRSEYMAEVKEINSIIQSRQNTYNSEIEALKIVFASTPVK